MRFYLELDINPNVYDRARSLSEPNSGKPWVGYPQSDNLTPSRPVQANGSQILHVIF